MTLNQFNESVANTLAMCTQVLEKKGKEYSLGDDRLEHFKEAAHMQEVSSEYALWGMLQKHLTSLSAMCKRGCADKGLWREKITDSVNYLLLLAALVEEGFADEEH